MNRQELLRERYEDALFALLMDEVATSEGEKALEENKRLQDDPNAQVPEDVDSKCMQTIRSHFAKLKRQAAQKLAVKAAGKIMAVVGVISTLFFTAFATSETMRANTLNLIVETFSDGTDFRFVDRPENHVVPQIFTEWLPDGYFLSGDECGSDDISSWTVYRNTKDGFVYLRYVDGDGSTVSIDTEDAEKSYVEINGEQETLFIKDNEIQTMWVIKDKPALIYVLSADVAKDDFLHIANSIKY